MSNTITIPFSIGEVVWTPSSGYEEVWETCPECAGTMALTLIKGNGEEVSLACNYCSPGFDLPTGRVKVSKGAFRPEPFTCSRIVGWEAEGPSYSESSEGATCYSFKRAGDLFRDKDECQARCDELTKDREYHRAQQVIANLESKRKSLSHSTHYWKSQVDRLERDLNAAKARLAVSKKLKAHRDEREREAERVGGQR